MKKTELKQKTELKRSTKPIKTEGPSTLRWKAWRRKQRAIAVDRSRGLCEWHNSSVCGPFDWHHCFGRSHIISEPWASFAPLTMMICRSIHIRADQDIEMRRILQRDATERLMKKFRIEFHNIWVQLPDPVDVVRLVISELEEQGLKPNVE
jgi:hypothetical protein